MDKKTEKTHVAKELEKYHAKEDIINKPKHYNSHPSGIECIQVTEHYNFNIGNCMKYLWRQGLKKENSNIQDLKKAEWYLKREINKLEKENK